VTDFILRCTLTLCRCTYYVINIIFWCLLFPLRVNYEPMLWCYTYAVCGYCTRTRTRSYCTRNIPGKQYSNTNLRYQKLIFNWSNVHEKYSKYPSRHTLCHTCPNLEIHRGVARKLFWGYKYPYTPVATPQAPGDTRAEWGPLFVPLTPDFWEKLA